MTLLLRALRRLREYDEAIGKVMREHKDTSAERRAVVELRIAQVRMRETEQNNGKNGHKIAREPY